MKRIISLILAATMAIFGSVIAAAESTELSFPMINTTGTVYLKGTSAIETNIGTVEGLEDSITVTSSGAIPNITSVTLEVQGRKYGNNYLVTDRYDFDNYDSLISIQANPLKTGNYWKLNLYDYRAPANGFLVSNFDSIYSLRITATGNFETKSEKVYNDWGTSIKCTDSVPAFTIVENFTNNNFLTNCIASVINEVRSFEYVSKEVQYDYGFIGDTDINGNGIVERNEVVRLSYSELGEGKGIPGFEGLASQVSKFFNGKDNGKIIFSLTSSETALAKTWEWGGIPSTQVGIFNNPDRISSDIIGLFFNYNNTGSLMAQGKIDKDRIVFDITGVLNDLGGYTTGMLENIYYGFIGGIQYNNYGKGLKIESVTLSYDTPEETIDTTVEINESVDEEIIEVEVEDESVETVVTEDTTITTTTTTITTTIPETTTVSEVAIVEDTTNENPMVVSKDSETTDADENPRTGAALLMFPVLFSGLGAICTRKKR